MDLERLSGELATQEIAATPVRVVAFRIAITFLDWSFGDGSWNRVMSG